MNDKNYRDLIKAHKILKSEPRAILYDEYMKSRDVEIWFRSGDVPMKEIFLLFGFILGWQPQFQGAPDKFREIYKEIFPNLKGFRESKLTDIEFTETIQKCIANIFDEVAQCTRIERGGKRRYESTGASKILHVLVPELFVTWDMAIRRKVLDKRDKKKDGNAYAFDFLPKMQEELREMVSYGKANYQTAIDEISKETDKYTLAKVLDEFNYVRYTLGKSLEEIRD